MKKFTILFFLLGLFISLNAQQIQPIKKNLGEKISREQQLHMQQMKRSAKNIDLGWVFPGDFVYQQAGGAGATDYSQVLFPDTTVVTVSIGTGGVGSKSHVWNIAVGQVLDPYSVVFDAGGLATPLVSNGASYIIDSITIAAWYSKRLAVNDTLVLEFTHDAYTTNNSFTDVYIPRTVDSMHFACPNMLGSPIQFGYKAKLTDPLKHIIKYTLTVNDSTLMYGKYIQIPVGITVPAGQLIGVSMTFVPGYSYVFGDTMQTYGAGAVQTSHKNTFLFPFKSEDANPSTGIFYDEFGQNLTYFIIGQGRYGCFTNALLNEIMYPMTDGSVDIGWKVQEVTACTEPATQATAFTSSAITNNSTTIGWTRGSGDGGVIVLARSGSAVNASPVSGTTYTANAAFGSGTPINTTNYVVYKGTGTSVNVTGLASGTPYYYAVYEYNSSGICFKTPGLTGTATTTGTAPLPVGGTAVATPNPLCSGNTTLVQLSGFTGTIMWQDSTVGGTWANVTGGTGATTADYTTAALTVKTFYRAKVSQTGIPSVFVYSTVVTVTVNSLPATPTITKTNPAPSFANLLTSSLATSYQWYNSSGIITGATSRTYTVTANGSYYVIVKNANGCSSAASNTIVISNVGIDFLSGNSFNIYPNPVNNFLSVELNSVSNTVISILDIIGNKVLEVIPTDNTTNINLSSLSSGVYMIRVMQNGKISTQKLIKE